MAFTESEREMAKRNLKQYCSKWTESRHDEIHNKPYFIGKRNKDSSTEILFPIDCYKSFTFDELKTSIIDSGSTAVNLAVYNSDSTVVVYKAEFGLKPPKDLCEKETSDILSPELSGKRKSDAIASELITTSLGIEQTETSSTDCLQIDLHPDNQSELSEAETADSEDSNLDDKSNSM